MCVCVTLCVCVCVCVCVPPSDGRHVGSVVAQNTVGDVIGGRCRFRVVVPSVLRRGGRSLFAFLCWNSLALPVRRKKGPGKVKVPAAVFAVHEFGYKCVCAL